MSLTPEFLWDCRGQKILVIEPFFYTPHVETGMELAEVLSEHNDVAYIGPDRLRCVTDETYRFSSRLLINCSRKRNVSSYLADSVRKYARAEIEGVRPANPTCWAGGCSVGLVKRRNARGATRRAS